MGVRNQSPTREVVSAALGTRIQDGGHQEEDAGDEGGEGQPLRQM